MVIPGQKMPNITVPCSDMFKKRLAGIFNDDFVTDLSDELYDKKTLKIALRIAKLQ